jgi:hypothetical protein
MFDLVTTRANCVFLHSADRLETCAARDFQIIPDATFTVL